MKRIAVLLAAICILSSASFAAGGITAVSVDVATGALGGIGMPSLRLAMSKDMSVDLGVNYSQTAANSSTIALMARVNNKLFAISKTANAIWGGNLTLLSATAAGVGATTISLNGTVGAEIRLTPDLAGFSLVNVIGLSQTSTGGASTTLVNLLTGPNIAYTGLTLYL